MAAELLGEGLKAFQKTATALITMYKMYLLIARFALNYSESNTLKLKVNLPKKKKKKKTNENIRE